VTAAPGPARILGWIKPDDGVRLADGEPDYECFRLDAWLHARGVAGVRVAVATSAAETGHGLEQLLGTGDPARLLEPARRLAALGAGALCWACTSGSFAGGLAWAEAQVRTLTGETGRPATSASLALVEAVHALGADVIDLLSPYPAPLTAILGAFFAKAGIAVRAVAALGCPAGRDSHRLDLAAAVAGFAGARAAGGVPLVIPDSAVDTLDRVADLEADLGRPVVTANQATLWQGLRLLGAPPVVPAAGRLLAKDEDSQE
jgi:maleate cis-trans isomerase